MDLTRATSQDIGTALDQAGVNWSYDDDGDVRVRFRSGQQPWIDAVFYEFDVAKADFSMRGQFLEGHAVREGNGMTRWEVPLGSGHTPTAIAQKVVTVYLMPRPGGISVQIHASIAPLDQPRPMHIKITPGSRQVSRIEREFSGFVGTGDSRQFWMSTRMSGTRVAEMDFCDMVSTFSKAGLAMFDGPFTGWLFPRDVNDGRVANSPADRQAPVNSVIGVQDSQVGRSVILSSAKAKGNSRSDSSMGYASGEVLTDGERQPSALLPAVVSIAVLALLIAFVLAR